MYMKQVILFDCYNWGFLNYGVFSVTHTLQCKFSLQNILNDTYSLELLVC
jgi:hypothetical protein